MNGDQFRCIVSTGSGSVTSPALSLTVASTGITTFAGFPGAPGSADGTGGAARFNGDGGLRLDAAGNIYVSDSSNDTIRKITPAGVVTTLAGSAVVPGGTDGPVSVARFKTPGGVAVDSTGNIYVADSGNYTIRKITPAGIVSTLAGTAGTRGSADGLASAARFEDPENLAVDSSGNIWVADGVGNTVRMVTPAGQVTTIAGKANSTGSTDGSLTGTVSSARFNDVLGVALDASGNVWISDSGNNTIRRMTQSGVVTTIAGSPGRTGSADGTGTGARFYGPGGLAVNPVGNVIVADSLNDTIREVTPAGVVTTIAGGTGLSENIDANIGTNARFDTPADIAIDS
jgi:sugar lactone lactonase YvrE